jgi:hypothetical protein
MGLRTRRRIRATPGFWHQQCKALHAAGTIRLVRIAVDEATTDAPIDYTVDDEETRNSGTETCFLPLPNADAFN